MGLVIHEHLNRRVVARNLSVEIAKSGSRCNIKLWRASESKTRRQAAAPILRPLLKKLEKVIEKNVRDRHFQIAKVEPYQRLGVAWSAVELPPPFCSP